MEARQGRTNTGNANQFNQNATGQRNTPHAVTSQARENKNLAVTGLIHRMLDVPRGCAQSPGASGRASETAQVRGLGYPVSRRPAAGTPAPPAPDTPKSGVAARHSRDSGQGPLSSKRGNLEGTVNGNLQIWSLSSPIPRGLLFGRAFRGHTLWASDKPPRKSGYTTNPLVLGRLLCDCAVMPRNQVPSLVYWVYPRREVGIRLTASRPGQEEKRLAFPCEQAIGVSDQRFSRNESCGQPQTPRTPRDSLPGL